MAAENPTSKKHGYRPDSGATRVENNKNLESIKGCEATLSNWYTAYCILWFGKYLFSIFMMAFLARQDYDTRTQIKEVKKGLRKLKITEAILFNGLISICLIIGNFVYFGQDKIRSDNCSKYSNIYNNLSSTTFFLLVLGYG